VNTQRRDELLNHEADGIREFDNALPRWWLWGFYFTIAFAVVYFINYELLFDPWFGRSSILSEYRAEVVAAPWKGEPLPPPGAPEPAPVAFLTDDASVAAGKAIFDSARSMCKTCHREDLGGVIGPDLTDDKWLHGCSAAELVQNVRTGFPSKGMMAFGSGQYLSDTEVLQVVSYIVSKRGSRPPNPKAPDAARDKDCK
jgi:cytochrome c oxidase cbb3-type subunit 3